ncbi:spore cortex biosynthesis protein YabQ [Bacillus carboniphilus]|uniref:spore cortex biosynthesis protein YabQ n=1 Tax=Bacillus carboniphilus TaxID=86663 RepID=UPI003531F33B
MTLSVQFYTIIGMVLVGIWLGLILDTYGHLLNRSMISRWVVFFYDLLFWVLQGLIIFYVLLLINEGEVRLYISCLIMWICYL